MGAGWPALCGLLCVQQHEVWHLLINRNITEISRLKVKQMVLQLDVLSWRLLLEHIREVLLGFKLGCSVCKPDLSCCGSRSKKSGPDGVLPGV